MLFADQSLTRRIENAERCLTTDVAEAIREDADGRLVFIGELGGGAAVHVGSGSPFNKLIGVGLHGPLEAAGEAALGSIERAFAARDTPLQAEVCTLADSSIPRLLTSRGYLLIGFENVLGLRLDAALAARLAETPPPAGVVAEPLLAVDDRAWTDTMIAGFAHPDAVPGGEPHDSFPRDALEQAMRDMARAGGFRRYVAWRDGIIAGGASLRIFKETEQAAGKQGGGVAQLCGSATLPEHRRRGVQTALLGRRLADAFSAGCDVAVITTQPGSKSQENAQRRGFTLLYSRAILVREPVR